MRRLICAAAATVSLTLGLTGPAAARIEVPDAATAVLQFCLQPEGHDERFLAATAAAGWRAAPATDVPAYLGDDPDYVNSMFVAPRPSVEGRLLVVLQHPKGIRHPVHTEVEPAICLVVDEAAGGSQLSRFVEVIGEGGRRAEGEPTWIYLGDNGKVRSAMELAGNADGIDRALKTKTTMIVILFEDSGRSRTMVAITRPARP